MHKSVLVIDDEKDILECLVDLIKTDFEANKIVTSLKFSDACIKSKNQHFDYAIVDYKLSGKETGIDFIKILRDINQANKKETKIMLLSAYHTPETVSLAKELRVEELLVKPLDFDRIKNFLNS